MTDVKPSLQLRSYEIALQEVLDAIILAFTNTDPIIGQIEVRSTGHSGPIRNVPGVSPVDHPLRQFDESFLTHTDAIRETNIDEFLASIADLASKI